jgi:hypothetical protein
MTNIYSYDAKILFTKQGKVNRPRVGCGRWYRYQALMQSETVGQFLAQYPAWNATLTRHIDAGNIVVVEGGPMNENATRALLAI